MKLVSALYEMLGRVFHLCLIVGALINLGFALICFLVHEYWSGVCSMCWAGNLLFCLFLDRVSEHRRARAREEFRKFTSDTLHEVLKRHQEFGP